MYCKACGEPLGPPQESLHDPDNLAGILDEGVSNPEAAHIKVVDGEKGFRYQCSNTGQMTKLMQDPPQEDKGSSGQTEEPKEESKGPERGSPSGTGGRSKAPGGGEVYDLKKDTDPMQILEEVISTPAYQLNDEQIAEVLSWGEIYDEQVPPKDLEEILANLKGVAKQQASLMAQKYEGKINKWMREQSSDSAGPSLGGAAAGRRGRGGRQRPMPPKTPQNRGGGSPETEPSEGAGGVEEDSSVRETRRKHRVSRRQEVMDEAAEKFASEAAANMAQDFGKMFAESREILITVFKKKAEKDPDWFLEKADEWDMDVFDAIMSPSEARRQEQKGGRESHMTSTDQEVMEAVQEVQGGGSQPQPQTHRREPEPEPEPEPDPYAQANPQTDEPEPTEDVNRDGGVDTDENPMKAAPDEEQPDEQESDDMFDELMGDVADN